MWINRGIRGRLAAVTASRPVTLVTGPRQTGKTSLLRRAFPDYDYVSLDLPRDAEQAEEDGQAFLARFGEPLIVDEVQYAPNLLRYLKAAVDTERDKRGRFLLTGSQKFALMAGVSESLAGRISLIELHSLSLRELEAGLGQSAEGDTLWRWLLRGGYPEIYAEDLEADRFYADYVATYLERDVRQALNVRNLRDFDRFLRFCALRSGQLLNMHALARDLGVATTTVKSWLSVLEASGIVSLLAPYFGNLGKRLVKTPKLYFMDTGLLCFLIGIRSVAEIERSALRGALFETLAYGQIRRHYASRGSTRDIFFYRDRDGTEVDFVIPEAERLHLLEVKASESPSASPPAFNALQRTLGEDAIASRTILSTGRNCRKVGEVTIESCVDLESLPA